MATMNDIINAIKNNTDKSPPLISQIHITTKGVYDKISNNTPLNLLFNVPETTKSKDNNNQVFSFRLQDKGKMYYKVYKGYKELSPSNVNDMNNLVKKYNSIEPTNKELTNSPYISRQNSNNFNGKSLHFFNGYIKTDKDITIKLAIDSDDSGDIYVTDSSDNYINSVGYYNGHGLCHCTSHNKDFTFKANKIYKFYIRLQDGGGDIGLMPYVYENNKWVHLKDSNFFKSYVYGSAIKNYKPTKEIKTSIINTVNSLQLGKYYSNILFSFDKTLKTIDNKYEAKTVIGDPAFNDVGRFNQTYMSDTTNTLLLLNNVTNIFNLNHNIISFWFGTKENGTYQVIRNDDDIYFKMYKKDYKYYFIFKNSDPVEYPKELGECICTKVEVVIKDNNCDIYIEREKVVSITGSDMKYNNLNWYIGSDYINGDGLDFIRSRTDQLRVFDNIDLNTELQNMLYYEEAIENKITINTYNIKTNKINTDVELSYVTPQKDNYNAEPIVNNNIDLSKKIIPPTEVDPNVTLLKVKSLTTSPISTDESVPFIVKSPKNNLDTTLAIDSTKLKQDTVTKKDINIITNDKANIIYSSKIAFTKDKYNRVKIDDILNFTKETYDDLIKYNNSIDYKYQYIKYKDVVNGYLSMNLNKLETNDIIKYYNNILHLEIKVKDAYYNNLTIKNKHLLKDNRSKYFNYSDVYYLHYSKFINDPVLEVYKINSTPSFVKINIKSNILTKLNYNLIKVIV